MIWRALLARLGISLVTLWVVSVLIFIGTNLLPGDVAQIILGQMATPENTAVLREKLGREVVLEKPKDRVNGHYATPIAFLFAKTLKKSPIIIVQDLVKELSDEHGLVFLGNQLVQLKRWFKNTF